MVTFNLKMISSKRVFTSNVTFINLRTRSSVWNLKKKKKKKKMPVTSVYLDAKNLALFTENVA